LSALLLRTESVASSKIERISASSDDYARASYGIKANASAVAMVAGTRAVEALITTVGQRDQFDLVAVASAHATLMADDVVEQRYAGHLRDVQNWIGGSDHSPRGAMYVPPPPELVEAYMADLLIFVNRDDVPVLAQAAVAHAQFESIHPFTDGNGRIGRALVNAIMRRRGTTTKLVVPLASALVAHRDRYFAALNAYRAGDHQTIISEFASASRIAAVESQRTAERLSTIPAEWRDAVGPVRADGAMARLLQVLPSSPAFTISDISDVVGASESSVYAAVERLQEAGVVRPVTDRRRSRIWGASTILDELEDLSQRIEAAAR
jgi:Fic family protein